MRQEKKVYVKPEIKKEQEIRVSEMGACGQSFRGRCGELVQKD